MKTETRGGRPKEIPDRAQMVQAASLFYNGGLKREDIAKRMHVQSRKITALLEQAREYGIVKILIDETVVESNTTQRRLQEKYPDVETIIVQSGTFADFPKRCAVVAATYFDQLVNAYAPKPIRVAVAGGDVFLEFVKAVPETVRKNLYVHVTALIGHGRLPKAAAHPDPQVVAANLWGLSGRLPGHLEYATVSPYAPAEPGPKGRKAVEAELALVDKNPTVRQVVEAMDDIDVVFAGIGIVNPKVSQAVKSRITMTALLQSVVTPQQLSDEGAIGDFSYCPFDKDGNRRDEWRFFMTAGHYSPKYWGIEFYKRMVATGRKVVGFGGPHKLPAIRIALQAKIVNVLITDQKTAEALAKGE